MAGPWNLSPNRGLGFASALAQGVEKGFGAYQARQDRNAALETKQMEMQSAAELRKLQMEKLRAEIAPIEFDLATWQTMDSGVSAGVIPERMRDKKTEEIFSKADTPSKLQFLSKMIDRKKQESLRKLSPTDLSQAFGGGMSDVMTVPDAPEAPAQANQPSLAGPLSGQPSGPIRFKNAKEAEFYKDLFKAKYGAASQFAGIQQRDNASQRTYESQMAGLASKASMSEDANETKLLLQEMKDLTQQFRTGADNATRENVAKIGALGKKDVAFINANSREKVAAKRRASGGRASADPTVKLLDSQILQVNKEIAALEKNPSGMGGFEMPKERQARRSNLLARYGELNQQRAEYLSGKGAPKAQGSVPKTPGVVSQGNPRPKFSRGPGVSAKIKALPEGAELELDGQVLVKQGDQLLPR